VSEPKDLFNSLRKALREKRSIDLREAGANTKMVEKVNKDYNANLAALSEIAKRHASGDYLTSSVAGRGGIAPAVLPVALALGSRGMPGTPQAGVPEGPAYPEMAPSGNAGVFDLVSGRNNPQRRRSMFDLVNGGMA
jgi:hypothetical protein